MLWNLRIQDLKVLLQVYNEDLNTFKTRQGAVECLYSHITSTPGEVAEEGAEMAEAAAIAAEEQEEEESVEEDTDEEDA